MKLHSAAQPTLVGGVQQTSKMVVEMNAMAFKMLFADYADNVTAPLRELVTNARDGNQRVGKDTSQIDIHLPTEFDTTFWVRDYGCSMDHSFMMTEYCQINHSTKRDDNDAVGAFGRGRISPLSYTSLFTVTTWQNGIENVYTVFIDSDGIPSVNHMGARPSSEPQGVRVSYPVKAEDVRRFRNAAQAVLFGFDPMPNVLNETYEQLRPEILVEGATYRVYSKTNSPIGQGIYAKQGCVIYPISRNALADLDIYFNQAFSMVVDFPIGDLTPTSSREGLIYDDPTKANLAKGFAGVEDEIKKLIVDKIGSQPSYIEACRVYMNMKNGYGSTESALYDMVKSSVNWNGRPLVNRIDLGNNWNARSGMYFESSDPRVGTSLYTLTFRQPVQSTLLSLDSAEKLKVFYELPDAKFGPSRMRKVLSEAVKGDKHILWLRPRNQEVLDELKAEWDFAEFVDLETVDPLKMGRAPGQAKAKNFLRLRVIEPTWRQNKRPAKYAEVCPDKATIFVEHRDSLIRFKGKSYSVGDFENWLHHFVNAKFLGVTVKVYLMTEIVEKRVKKFLPNPTMLDDIVDRALERLLKVSTLKIDEYEYETKRNNQYADYIRKADVPLWGNLQTFVETYKSDPVVSSLTSDQTAVLREFCPNVFQKVQGQPHAEVRAALLEEYPVLGLILDRTYDHKAITSLLAHYLPLVNPNK